MDYKIIIYKLIVFKIRQGTRDITKKYFQKVKTINNINIKELSQKNIEYKKIYKDNCYIFNMLKENEEDTYFNNLNNKSYNYYKKYIESR